MEHKPQGPSGIITIARKEFFDHIRSRKFILIFSIFLVIAIIGMIGGIAQYGKDLKAYNDQRSTASSSLVLGYMDDRPSIMTVFETVATYLSFLGAILGIAMGFDLVTKEKESKSLKILLSHPVYRDEVINGKALGGIAALFLALAIVLSISLATLLIYGIVPNGGELILIAVFGAVSFLFIFTYFSIALFMSTVSPDSGSALIFTMIIFILLSSLLPTMANDTVMEAIAGPSPQMPQELLDQMNVNVDNATKNAVVSFSNIGSSPAWQEYNEKTQAYWDKRTAIQGVFALFSPTMNYDRISQQITSAATPAQISYRSSGYLSSTVTVSSASSSFEASGHQDMDIPGILGGIVSNLVALLVFPACFFALSYARFMRMDVR
ncbi:MAG: ABC transporter permease subunit [Methanoregula sp.]|jgi:ABC-2 type transport system permease protein